MKTFPTTVLLRRLTAVGGEKAADATSGVAQWNRQPRERGAWFVTIRLIADQEKRAARVMDVLIGVHADQAMFPAMIQRNDSKECASPVNRLSEQGAFAQIR